jgi:putative cell wall-binding protein
VLLTKKTYVPAPTQAAIEDLGHPKLIAVGSNVVISDALYAQLGCIERLGGQSRYDTAKAVAQYGLAHGFSDGELIVTTGQNFPDALVSGVVSAKHGCPIMLVNSAGLPSATADYISEHPNLQSITVVGSAKAISEEVENQIVDQLVY